MKISIKTLSGNLLAILALALLVVTPVSEIMAQEEPATPGIIFGTGTSFAVTDSDYLNVTLTSTAEVDVMINSVPMIIHISVAAAAGDTSTDITLGGLGADTTYWLYQDADIDGVQFSTDANGDYSLTVDLSDFRDFVIQPEKSTVLIHYGGRDCSTVGNWDATTKTCTLTQDVNDSIYIYTSGVTLDGAGHTVNLPQSGRVRLNGSGHTVQNVNIQGQVIDPIQCGLYGGYYCRPTGYGIWLYLAQHSTIQNVTVNGTYIGIYLYRSSYNDVSESSFNAVGFGAYLFGWQYYGQNACDTYKDYHCGASYNTLIDNQFSSNDETSFYGGIYMLRASRNNVFRGNTLSDFTYGLFLYDPYCTSTFHQYCSAANSIYQNNFIDSDYQIFTYRGGLAGNTFNQSAPDGGNYYSDFDEPFEGCNDLNADRFCDTQRPVFTAYGGYYGADYLPWTTQGGWNNAAPVPDAGGPYSGNEGSAIGVSASATDADGDVLTFAWSVDGSGCAFANASVAATTVTCDDNGNHTLTVSASDGTASVSDTASLTVNNVVPTVTITAPVDGAIIPINESIQVMASLGDPGSVDTHVCSVSFGDGDSQSPVCSTAGGLTSSLYPYAEAGVYEVSVTATDDDGGESTATVMIVVYDPSAGFVTGGGWIDSPEGAYTGDVTLTGKANFGFVSKYKKGASRPTGETQFVFKAGDLNFHSDTYQWLVVNQNGANAQYKGTGTINGALDPYGMPFGFMLWGMDGDNADPVSTDMFRIRIWSETPAGEADVYDNGFNQSIGGGAIVIHTGGKGGKK